MERLNFREKFGLKTKAIHADPLVKKKMMSTSRLFGVEPEYVLNNIGNVEGLVVYDMGCFKNKTHKSFIGVDVCCVDGVDICTSADNLSMINSDSADFIVSRHSFEHFLNPCRTLTEWKRILKPTGKIIFILPDNDEYDTILDAPLDHLHAYNMESFRDLIEYDGSMKIEKLEKVIKGWSFGAVVSLINKKNDR